MILRLLACHYQVPKIILLKIQNIIVSIMEIETPHGDVDRVSSYLNCETEFVSELFPDFWVLSRNS